MQELFRVSVYIYIYIYIALQPVKDVKTFARANMVSCPVSSILINWGRIQAAQ